MNSISKVVSKTVITCCVFSLCFFLTGLANSGPGKVDHQDNSIWRDISDTEVTRQGDRLIVPTKYRLLRLDEQKLIERLNRMPPEQDTRMVETHRLAIPMPDGSLEHFECVLSPIMEPELAAKFPEIKTYRGQGIYDEAASIRFDHTPAGFHAMILSPSGTVFIDPYQRNDTVHYISYYKRDFFTDKKLICHTGNIDLADHIHPGMSSFRAIFGDQAVRAPSGTQLRTYRAVVAATGEYTTFHGSTVPAGMAAITTTMNRVVGIYEVEVAVRMVLVANNNLVVYTNGGTDPYTNNNGGAMLGENQTNCDAVIGTANYDIGHVVSTGGGGIANLQVPCVAGMKARGVTGSPSPIGDPFDVDYVAHEMGHQYGANHTFNGTTLSCGGGNRNAGTAYEPGSASTIMGYAGICGTENLQSNSDPYFHTISFDEIVSFTTLGAGNNCPTITATGNNPPTVNAGPAYTIPMQTPFELTGSATDLDGDTMTYCWEEFDLGTASPPLIDDGSRPIFRSFNPVSGPTRIVPKLSDVLNNTTSKGEYYATTTRPLNFRLTARDGRTGGGGVDYALVAHQVTNTSGPFVITAPNTAVSWNGNETQTVTWNVANTTSSPVSCAQVNITLSADGGGTFPYVLATNVPNNGSALIVVPNIDTTSARIKVAGANNIFFDLTNSNFSITSASVVPTLNVYVALALVLIISVIMGLGLRRKTGKQNS
ncbi:reprolysin-like metallopeptidase [candidate division CSSED10-310 bacterium]|uniref:Reprolysin-like metallopeptidase n=1 Tax=candidate division CSSED10-310 bacterium TaxID=2855610 RepID=A0ABV6YR75_UNCC1